jgi:outer membrane protein assembly factor BamA
VILEQVEFQGDNPLTAAEQADLVKQIKQNPATTTSDATNTDWAAEATEVIVPNTFMDRGYFKVQPTGTPYLIRAAEDGLHFGLIIGIKSGPQCHLGNVSFVNTNERNPLAFSEGVLQQQLEVQHGDLLNASKIRTAMEKMTRMYVSDGYLDMVPEPEMSIDDKNLRIDLTFKMDEGVSYRISGIDVLGSETSKRPLVPQAIRQAVNRPLWRKFFNDNQSLFPQGANFDSSIKMTRDARARTTQITVDFRACPSE